VSSSISSQRADELQDENWSLKLALIDINQKLNLAKIGFRGWYEMSEEINKLIEEKLNGTLVHKGCEAMPYAEDEERRATARETD
jgi:hypothetical protein